MSKRDHGGGLDAAISHYGGSVETWVDLSTGINPVPYPVPDLPLHAWTRLPDEKALERLIQAARAFWRVPNTAEILATPGASLPIALMPAVTGAHSAEIPKPTYNEHQAAFISQNVPLSDHAEVSVHVHPNNPDGRLWTEAELDLSSKTWAIIDESFCDCSPEHSHIALARHPNVILQKSFGKFWGLAGMRLGFVIAPPKAIEKLRNLVGPWAVAGPALEIGAKALEDYAWAQQTRDRLRQDSARLDQMLAEKGAKCVGGTTLFRLYEVPGAAEWQHRLAEQHVLTRIFPYSKTWLRLGLPAPHQWAQLEAALEHLP